MMKAVKYDNSLGWYVSYSVFSLMIVIGVFSILSIYSQAAQEQADYNKKLGEITFNTISSPADMDNLLPVHQEHKKSIMLPAALAVIGIAGFLFTKYLYETKVRGFGWQK